MSTSIVIGVLAILFGLFTGVARFVAPDSGVFSKQEAMKERFGSTVGTAIHVLAYTVLPMIFGVLQILRGLAEGAA